MYGFTRIRNTPGHKQIQDGGIITNIEIRGVGKNIRQIGKRIKPALFGGFDYAEHNRGIASISDKSHVKKKFVKISLTKLL